MNVRDNEVFAPIDLINARTLSSVINSFLNKSVVAVLDQTFSEITNKRRISALGPGGLSRSALDSARDALLALWSSLYD